LGQFATILAAGQTLGEITLGAFMGAGSGVNLEFGGAKATTEGIAYENPFGNIPPFAPGGPALTVTRTPGSPSLPAEPASPGTTGSLAVQTGPTSERCETTHARGEPGCSRGWWPAVALAAMLAAGLFSADYAKSHGLVWSQGGK
jgi:hypothetical protein